LGRKAGKVVSLKDWIVGMGKRRTGGIKRKLPCPNKTQLVPSETRNKNQGKNLNPGLDKAGLIEGWVRRARHERRRGHRAFRAP